MEAVFLKILNMSITAGWLTLAVLVVRLLMKKAPKWITVLLWALVGIRLVCPISPESAFSLIPSAETIPANILYTGIPEIHSGLSGLNALVNPILTDTLAPAADTGVNPVQTVTGVASVVWLVGVAGMLLYTAVSYRSIRKRVREAIPLRGNIRLCDHVDTPFILGVLRPRIFLPSAMEEQDLKFVIAHEKAHIKRHDHWWKPLGFLLLAVYWFNPILWIAYILFCRDIELACDEKVIRELGAENKRPYSNALIDCSVPQNRIASCPLAFGEGNVKGRVKFVLNYKKPAFWITLVAILSCAVVAVCFLTDPIQAAGTPVKLSSLSEEECRAYLAGLGVVIPDEFSNVSTVWIVAQYEEDPDSFISKTISYTPYGDFMEEIQAAVKAYYGIDSQTG